jgi:acyl-CoA synthetase (AMP-forming)/AMP-acid ligase II
VQISWFRQPSGDDPGSLNLCYHAVDLAVIRGAAVDPAVRHPGGELDYATLLERVAALAGALRGLGAVPGAPVGVLLDDPVDELLAVLAVARLGAVVLALDPDDPSALLAAHRPALVATSRRLDLSAHAPAAVLLHGPEVLDETRDLAWDLALRAGRTDPAPCAPVSPGDPAYIGADEVAVIDVPGHDSLLGRAVSALADRVPVDLTGTRP